MASLAAVGAAFTAIVIVTSQIAHVCIWSLCGLAGF